MNTERKVCSECGGDNIYEIKKEYFNPNTGEVDIIEHSPYCENCGDTDYFITVKEFQETRLFNFLRDNIMSIELTEDFKVIIPDKRIYNQLLKDGLFTMENLIICFNDLVVGGHIPFVKQTPIGDFERLLLTKLTALECLQNSHRN